MAKASEIASITESQAVIEAEMLRGELAEAHNEMMNVSLRVEEQMSSLSLMLDSQGWLDLTAYPEDGPTLAQVQEAGRKLRSLTGLNSPIGAGARLRHAYVWEGGLHHDGIPGARQGRGLNVQAIINDPINQANFFGSAARERQEKACYTNGHYFVIGEEAKRGRNGRAGTPKRLRNLPLYQITAAYVNPDDPTEVWAVRRSWSKDGLQSNSGVVGVDGTLEHEWIWMYTQQDIRPASIKYNGADEAVNRNKVLFMEQVNRLDGWTWGLPDAIAAMAWADQHRRGVLNGLKMQEALATLAFKLKGQSANAVNGAASKVQNNTVKGGTAAMVDGMDVAALSTAGRGYDFDSLRPVLALVAAAIDVSVVALSSDPGAAGSSYGSAQTLDAPTRLRMMARRLIHMDFERTVLEWLGAPDAKVYYDPMIDGAELYRELQALLLPYLQGLYSPQQQRDIIDSFMGWPSGSVPQGVLVPANAASLARRDVDTDAVGSATVAAPDQGTANGVGGQGTDSGNDVRQDTIT
jgi:hypothetical protein